LLYNAAHKPLTQGSFSQTLIIHKYTVKTNKWCSKGLAVAMSRQRYAASLSASLPTLLQVVCLLKHCTRLGSQAPSSQL